MMYGCEKGRVIVKRFIMLMAVVVAALTCGMGEKQKVQAGTWGTRGVWVSCFEFEKLGLKDKTESEFRANASRIFATIKGSGCNTVYFHVRAFDDAIYPSQVTRWSKYVTSTRRAPSYDPLKILIELAHKRGLKFHAWLNPYRVTQKKVLDPAKAATTDRIVRQVSEIVNHYAVDGIHFDDYFYPTNEKKYNKVSKAARKKNVNAMVKKIYNTVKAKKSSLKFGISPAGDIKYCEKIGADVRTWLSGTGYVDYIVPQIYWSDQYIMKGKKTALFRDRLAEWRAINTQDIPMYVGLALYKTGYSLKEDPGWRKSSGNISRQLKMIRAGNTEGYVLFSYSDLIRSGAAKELKNYYKTIGKLKLNKKKKTMRAGKKYRLRASFRPSRLTGKIKWRSSNKKVATVSKSGVVKAKKKGKARIYLIYGNWKKCCTIRVKKKKRS